MKKLLFLVNLYFLPLLVSFGQAPPGTWLLGGNFNIGDWSHRLAPSGDHSFSQRYEFALEGGKLIRPHLAAGLSLNYSINETGYRYSGGGFTREMDIQAQSWSVGPFIQKYVPVADKLYFFGLATTGITFQKVRQETRIDTAEPFLSTSSTSGVSARLAPGLTYLISPKIGLDLSVAGLSYSYLNTRETHGRGHHLDLGLNLSSLKYGFRFYFTR
jgi:hypothetical protein